MSNKRQISGSKVVKKKKEDVDYSTQSRMTHFFESPKVNRKISPMTGENCDNASSQVHNHKKEGKELLKNQYSHIITLDSDSSDQELSVKEKLSTFSNKKRLLDNDSKCLPPNKKKGVVKKAIHSVSLSKEMDPVATISPVKFTRNALVSLNVDKTKNNKFANLFGNESPTVSPTKFKFSSLSENPSPSESKCNQLERMNLIIPSQSSSDEREGRNHRLLKRGVPGNKDQQDVVFQKPGKISKQEDFKLAPFLSQGNFPKPSDNSSVDVVTGKVNQISSLSSPKKVAKKKLFSHQINNTNTLRGFFKSEEANTKLNENKSFPSKQFSVSKDNCDTAGSSNQNEVKTFINGREKVRRIIRQSGLHVEGNDVLSITSKFEVGSEEINSAARTAFDSTYKDVETLLGMNYSSRICPDLQWAETNNRQQLSKRYHTNFNFFLSRDNQEVGAIGALRRLGRHHYPSPEDLHAIVFRIIWNTANRVALFRAQEYIYNVLSLHPPCNKVMRDYYWAVLCTRFGDYECCSRWELYRSLLEEVVNASGGDLRRDRDLNNAPEELERKEAVLKFLIRLLDEDLYCWVRETGKIPPIARLRHKNDVPLVARLMWPTSDVAYVSIQCRELLTIHTSALESNNRIVLSYTKSLVGMMVSVTQMYDLHLPLKMRTPGERMCDMARQISLMTDVSTAATEAFLTSFPSTELRLLLSLSIINRIQPSASFLTGERPSLGGVMSLLSKDNSSTDDLIVSFQSQSEGFRICFLMALVAYFKQYGTFKTWFTLRERYKKSRTRLPGRSSPEPIEMFSRTYTMDSLVDDLRQTKYLLQADGKKPRTFCSLFST